MSNSFDEPSIITNINDCEVTIRFKPKTDDSIDVMEKVKWLILQCFKERIGFHEDTNGNECWDLMEK